MELVRSCGRSERERVLDSESAERVCGYGAGELAERTLSRVGAGGAGIRRYAQPYAKYRRTRVPTWLPWTVIQAYIDQIQRELTLTAAGRRAKGPIRQVAHYDSERPPCL